MKSITLPSGKLVAVREIGKRLYEWFPVRQKTIHLGYINICSDISVPEEYIGKRVRLVIELVELPAEPEPKYLTPRQKLLQAKRNRNREAD